MPNIQGYVARGYEKVSDTFQQNFSEYGEVGAAFCLYRDGAAVVDIWSGYSDQKSHSTWQENTIQLVFSAAKGITAACMLMLVERGKLDLDAPIAQYWPEFAANDKQNITTRMVLSHRAGLAAVEGSLSLADVFNWQPVVNAIAAQRTNWEPNTAHGYHARSYGWILGEILRRIEGRTLGDFLQSEVCSPLALDLWIGLPQDEHARCAKVIPPPGGTSAVFAKAFGPDSLGAKVMNGPSDLFDYNEMWNSSAMLSAEMPSSNAVADARSLAKFYSAIIGQTGNGDALLRPETLQAALEVQSEGQDKVAMIASKFGLGFSLPPMLSTACGENSFGHPGAGGSTAFADPDAQMSLAYIPNRMLFEQGGDPRSTSLIKAVYACL